MFALAGAPLRFNASPVEQPFTRFPALFLDCLPEGEATSAPMVVSAGPDGSVRVALMTRTDRAAAGAHARRQPAPDL